MGKIALGRQYLIEFGGCDPAIIGSGAHVRGILLEATQRLKATIIKDLFHSFNPHGVSGVVVIAQSHVAVHTWPEHRLASMDIFTCSEGLDIDAAIGCLKAGFGANSVSITEVKRGVVD